MPKEKRGGKRAPDFKPRPVSGPGKFSERADLTDPKNLPYGNRQALEEARAAVPLPQGSPGVSPSPSPGAPAPPPASPPPNARSVIQTLAYPPLPGEFLQPPPQPRVLSATDAAFQLEQILMRSPEVSSLTLNALNDLKKRSMLESAPADDLEVLGILSESIRGPQNTLGPRQPEIPQPNQPQVQPAQVVQPPEQSQPNQNQPSPSPAIQEQPGAEPVGA